MAHYEETSVAGFQLVYGLPQRWHSRVLVPLYAPAIIKRANKIGLTEAYTEVMRTSSSGESAAAAAGRNRCRDWELC